MPPQGERGTTAASTTRQRSHRLDLTTTLTALNARISRMSDRDDFLTWVTTALYEAEVALHNGDAGPRRALWSRNEPVSVLGAWRSARGQEEVQDLFDTLAAQFSDCTSYRFELQAYDVLGDMAYT